LKGRTDRIEPAMQKKLVKMMHFCLPYDMNGPENKAPRADPAVVSV